MNARRNSSIELAGYVTLVACLGIVQFTIFGANLIVIPGVLWLILALREGRRPDVPAFFWPLVVLAGWTLLSCAFSVQPVESITRSRQLLLFMIVPMTARLLRGDRAMTAINVIIALGAAGALVGIVEYAALGFDERKPSPAWHARPLHDVLRRADAGDVRGGGQADLLPEGMDLAGDRRSGPAGRAGLHGVPQRVGRHPPRRRSAARAPQSAAAAPRAGRGGAVRAGRAPRGEATRLFHSQSARTRPIRIGSR